MFVGRDFELNNLNNIYNEGNFECIFIYGRRRVGKSELIKEFIKDKPSIYFIATESTEQENLNAFSKAVIKYQGYETGGFDTFEALLDSLTTIDERLVLVIDEYPYLADSYKAMSSLLQKYIDMYFNKSKLFIILCGSSMSFMENETTYKKPLYGRKTGQIKLEPFTFFEARQMLNNYTLQDQVLAYAVTGGVPYYLSLWDNDKSVKDNIIKLFFNPLGSLYEEPQNLLKQELREPNVFNAIIRAIANGASRNSVIATKVGIENSACSNYLMQLIKLGIVKKETPILSDSTKKTIYSLSDSMFVFWYRYVPEYRLLIECGMGERLYEKIKPDFSVFLGKCFETICKDWLKMQNINLDLPFVFNEIGKWWGGNSKTKQEEEIDIMAHYNQNLLLAECKYTNEDVDVLVLKDLFAQGEMFDKYKKYYYVFAKNGFSVGCKEFIADEDNVKLITLEDMCK